MIKTLGIVWGILFLLGGILGFVPGITNGGLFLGIFLVNTPHGIMHIASGMIFLAASGLGARAARLWFLLFGTFYAALGVYGVWAGDGLICGLISNNLYDGWGHIFLGLVLLLVGFTVPSTAARSHLPVLRYHPALVTLHWLIAIAIAAPLVLGEFVLAKLPNTDPLIYHGLRAHMGVGFLIGMLMLARLFFGIGTRRPKPATTGSALLDRAAQVSHALLYLAVFGQVVTGLVLALQGNLVTPVLAGEGPLPTDFSVYPVFAAHYVFSRLLVALIVLHVLGFAYHRIILRDSLLGRMSFGRRETEGGAPELAAGREKVDYAAH
jgi:cytochrome b561